MMNLNPFGRGDATNQSPTGDAGSPEMGRIERGRGRNAPSSPSFPSKSRRRGSAEADAYKARCSDLERNIIQLKLELAEAKTTNAYIVKENQTLNKELKEQQGKVGQLLVDNSKHTMASMQLRRELEMSGMREGLLKGRVDKLNEENVNLRHFAERNGRSLGNLLKAGSSTNSLVSSLSGVFGGDSMGNLSKRSGSQSGLGSAHGNRSASANQMSRANSYGLKRSTSAAVVGNSSFHGNAASHSSFHQSAPSGQGGNASWDVPGPAAPMGGGMGMGGSGANMFLSILEGEAM